MAFSLQSQFLGLRSLGLGIQGGFIVKHYYYEFYKETYLQFYIHICGLFFFKWKGLLEC